MSWLYFAVNWFYFAVSLFLYCHELIVFCRELILFCRELILFCCELILFCRQFILFCRDVSSDCKFVLLCREMKFVLPWLFVSPLHLWATVSSWFKIKSKPCSIFAFRPSLLLTCERSPWSLISFAFKRHVWSDTRKFSSNVDFFRRSDRGIPLNRIELDFSCIVTLFSPSILDLADSCKTIAHASLMASAGSHRREKLNLIATCSKWKINILHDFESFFLSETLSILVKLRLVVLIAETFQGYGICLFYWPFMWIAALRAALSRHGHLDFAVKFRFVFRYEAVVFRRYVLALLLASLLQKFQAYLVYLSLIWNKNPQPFSLFQKFRMTSFQHSSSNEHG